MAERFVRVQTNKGAAFAEVHFESRFLAVTTASKRRGGYSLTHIPTGYAIAFYDDPAELERLAQLLDGFDWDFTEPDKAIPMLSAQLVVAKWKADLDGLTEQQKAVCGAQINQLVRKLNRRRAGICRRRTVNHA